MVKSVQIRIDRLGKFVMEVHKDYGPGHAVLCAPTSRSTESGLE